MTLSEKAHAIAKLFDEGRGGDAYRALEQMLAERKWPQWLRDDVRLLGLDEPKRYQGKAGL